MLKEEQLEKEEDIELKAPFGWSVRASGRYIVLFLLIALSTGLLVYILRELKIESANQAAEQIRQLSVATEQRAVQLRQIAAQQQTLQDSMDSMLYILSLSQEDRSRLKLAMPQALRIRLLTQER